MVSRDQSADPSPAGGTPKEKAKAKRQAVPKKEQGKGTMAVLLPPKLQSRKEEGRQSQSDGPGSGSALQEGSSKRRSAQPNSTTQTGAEDSSLDIHLLKSFQL